MENTKKPVPAKSQPMRNGVALPWGELKRAIIGTVVRLGREEGGATATRVYETLAGEGYNVTRAGTYMWLGHLHNIGAIERVSRGVYEGV